jgi:hypothetical protein
MAVTGRPFPQLITSARVDSHTFTVNTWRTAVRLGALVTDPAALAFAGIGLQTMAFIAAGWIADRGIAAVASPARIAFADVVLYTTAM